MSAKEQLLNELEHAPDAMLEEILDFCLFLKQRQQQKIPKPSPPSEGGIASLLDLVAQIHAQVPPEEWEKLPRDLSINHDHYLYGSPKVEE
ncbi:MAG: hypothetical protein KME45_21145 [Stenomitos rutilans HA7619-LM2]|nr:hypothetical protein [Stenomitos rutilans HA7619-LM2]